MHRREMGAAGEGEDDNVDNFYFIRQRCKLDKIRQKEEVQSKSVSEKL